MYSDPNAGLLRAELFMRLRFHFQFQNKLFLFREVHDEATYSVNVYAARRPETHFTTIANLYSVATIDASFKHDGRGLVSGIKTAENEWNVEAHMHRIIEIDADALTLFALLYDAPDTPANQARLPMLHASELVDVLRKFACHPKRLGDLEGQYRTTVMWDETGAVQHGTIKRYTTFPAEAREWIISGPHFSTASPFAKTPRAQCTARGHYDPLDLTELPPDYIPRTNYMPACDEVTYRARTPTVPWDPKRPVTDFYRLIARGMLSHSGERTLIASIIPKFAGHIHGAQSIVFVTNEMLVEASVAMASLTTDFFTKTTGKTNLNNLWTAFPNPTLDLRARARALLLNCLTNHYAELWRDSFDSAFTIDGWTKPDPRLSHARFCTLTADWQWSTPLRSDYERRQALIEIDVLTARAVGLTLDELRTIYRIQFPVLQQYERNTFYDRNGRIVYLDGDTAYGLSTPEWKNYKDKPDGPMTRTIDEDDTLPGGPRQRVITYVAPFDACDRETDYAVAWAEFDRRERATVANAS